jgi:CRISPR-associated protein Cas1
MKAGLPPVTSKRQALTTTGGMTPMAASHNVLQSPNPGKSPISKSGVLTIHGFGVRVSMHSGHLEIEDGVGPERRKIRLARVGHGLKRLVCISEDGFTTLSALKWLSNVRASFLMLSRTGEVLFVIGPTAPSDARLRRTQSLALGNGIGLEISRTLINAKLEGQERLARESLNDFSSAQAIARCREKLSVADSVAVIRTLEAHAAISYFGAWRDVPILWPKGDLRRVPDHWRTVGSRHSPLSGGPRLAVNPVHAILNYCFALLESESRLAVSALGLDPGLGMGLHTDMPNRDSLALDVLEPVRPQIEDWLLSWIMREPLRRSDFFETATGNCRLMSHLCAKLGETAPSWGKLVAPWAEYVARTLWANTSRPKAGRSFPTNLTQQHRREAKARPSFPTIDPPKPDRVCRGCGRQIPKGRRFCAECAVSETRENFEVGREAAQRPEYLAKRSATQRLHRQAIQNWKASDLPSWLTREVYVTRVRPALASVLKARIRLTLGVSEPYSQDIQSGKRIPHPRHWQVLAQLAGFKSVETRPSP